MELDVWKSGIISFVTVALILLVCVPSAVADEGSVSYQSGTDNLKISVTEEKNISLVLSNNDNEPLLVALSRRGLENIKVEFPDNIMIGVGENRVVDVVLSSTEACGFSGEMNVGFYKENKVTENLELLIESNVPIQGIFTAENVPIEPKFTFQPLNPDSGERIVFDASDSVGIGVNLVLYTWYFGDNSIGTGKVIDHKYEKEGTYKVTLTVKDDVGNKLSISKKIKVKEKSPIGRGTYFLVLTISILIFLIIAIWRRGESEEEKPSEAVFRTKNPKDTTLISRNFHR